MIRQAALAALLVISCTAQAPPSARMDEIVRFYVTQPRRFISSQQFMGSVLVARNGELLFSKGYGFANLEWQIPNTPDTKFRLASITKQFTAASILLLAERGKLKIEDPVKKYMPDAPAAWDKLTLFHLLTHTSGIPSYSYFPELDELAMPASPAKLVELFRNKPLDFQPGEQYSYSDSSFTLLGYLIEKISGQSYAEFVRQNIFVPLGMKDSGYDSSTAILSRRAAGYERRPDGSGLMNARYIDMSVPYAAGALYSTPEDLLRWEQALFAGKLLSPDSIQKMTTPFKDDYGFGLHIHKVNGHKVIDHTGDIQGFDTYMGYYPEDGLTVIVLSNLGSIAPSIIAEQLVTVARGETVVLPSEQKEITVAAEILTKYIGTYDMGRNKAGQVYLTITLENGHLMAQATGTAKMPIFAQSETTFFMKTMEAHFEFFTDDKHETTHLMLHEGGRLVRGDKK